MPIYVEPPDLGIFPVTISAASGNDMAGEVGHAEKHGTLEQDGAGNAELGVTGVGIWARDGFLVPSSRGHTATPANS